MNANLQKLLPTIETWPDEDQEALVEAAREIAALRTGVYVLLPDEDAAIAEGLEQADKGSFADDVRIQALWRRASFSPSLRGA
jgi:hypothetical protein